jgi:hypothetical protein
MVLKAPTTKKDFEKIKITLIELLNNPYITDSMTTSLKVRLQKTEEKLKEFNFQENAVQ